MEMSCIRCGDPTMKKPWGGGHHALCDICHAMRDQQVHEHHRLMLEMEIPNSRKMRSRTEKTCDLCHEKIKKGDTYGKRTLSRSVSLAFCGGCFE